MSLTVLQRRSLESSQSPVPDADEALTGSPRIWYHRILKRSVTTQSRARHPNRLRSFTSLKELAASSHQSLKPLSDTRQVQVPTTGGKSLSPKHMSLTDLRRSPTPDCRPPGTYRALSKYSSIESLTPDLSALSYNSSQPTTPSPGRQLSYYLPAERELYPYRKMGQKGSTLVKNSIGARNQQIPAASDTSPEVSADGLGGQESGNLVPPALHRRESSSKLPVPRRRSSLTALHLDSSHFELPLSHHPGLSHRGSTVSEKIKPLARTPSTIIPPTDRTNRLDTLSPPQLSPRQSSIRPSTASSLTASQSSQVPSPIHLPRTFPEGSIVIGAPPLNVTHYKCYHAHRRMQYSKNKFYPVPCMTCGLAEPNHRWRCLWCALRVCESCMAEFEIKKRNLEELMTWLDKSDEKRLEEEEVAMARRQREPQNESLLRTPGNPVDVYITAKVLKEAR